MKAARNELHATVSHIAGGLGIVIHASPCCHLACAAISALHATAPKAFWPSTNAYCAMFRRAARIAPAWAIALLQGVKDPEIKVAAEIALAVGWLKAPIGPSTIMTNYKNSNLMFLSSRE